MQLKDNTNPKTTQRVYVDKVNKFISVFNTENGFHYISSVIENGVETAQEPFMSEWPLLADIGIMGKCTSQNTCKVGCYQQGGKTGHTTNHNMSFATFKKIVDELAPFTHSFALGGFGNPNDHPEFESIMKYARSKNVTCSYTTAGNSLTDKQIDVTKKYGGSVAVSWHDQPYTYSAIERFISAGVSTNIHYVLGNSSIDKAIWMLENNGFPEGLNAVVFLLYKPAGRFANDKNVIQGNDPRLAHFYNLVDKGNDGVYPFSIGVDACNMVHIVNHSKNIDKVLTGSCDAAKFSVYVTADGYVLPCSFDTTLRRFAVPLEENGKYLGIRNAWKSPQFEAFRNFSKNSCGGCKVREKCQGGCALFPQINTCYRPEQELYVITEY